MAPKVALRCSHSNSFVQLQYCSRLHCRYVGKDTVFVEYLCVLGLGMKKPWVHTGTEQSKLIHWGGQMQVSGATQVPPFRHVWVHTGIRQSLPVHWEGHAHVLGAVQLPPLAQVLLHTGVVQLESNHPEAQEQVSGAVQVPPLKQF